MNGNKEAPESDEPQIAEPVVGVFWKKYRKTIFAVGGTVAAVVAIAIWQWNSWGNAEKKAEALYSEENSPESWEALLAQYPKSPRAPEALLNLAAFSWEKGEFEQAVGYYQEFVRKFPRQPALPAVELAIAACLEAQEKMVEAREAYLRITQAPQHPFLGPASISLARIYEQEGNIPNARQVLVELMNQAQPSRFLVKAQAMLEQLPKSGEK